MLILQGKLKELGLFHHLPATAPIRFIDVGWGGKETETVALLGNVLPMSSCLEKPTVYYRFEGIEEYLTYLSFDADKMNDADVNSPATCYLQWARINVKGDLQYATGRDVFRWQPAVADERTPPHRIFIVVASQEREVDLSSIPVIATNSKEGRARFEFAAFAKRYGLRGFVGANCFRVSFEPMVAQRITSNLRDSIELDASGRKVVSETNNGVKVVYGPLPATTGAA